jgi:uncharacterized protein YqeY
MTLFEQINEDIKSAMKAKEKERLEALRAVKAQLLLLKTAEGASETISEEDEIKVIQKMIKQRKESGAIYQQQNRPDLGDKELLEATFLEVYLPKQFSDTELTVAIEAIITKVGALSLKDLGKVMGIASKELAGKSEGKAIADKVKLLLNK